MFNQFYFSDRITCNHDLKRCTAYECSWNNIHDWWIGNSFKYFFVLISYQVGMNLPRIKENRHCYWLHFLKQQADWLKESYQEILKNDISQKMVKYCFSLFLSKYKDVTGPNHHQNWSYLKKKHGQILAIWSNRCHFSFHYTDEKYRNVLCISPCIFINHIIYISFLCTLA